MDFIFNDDGFGLPAELAEVGRTDADATPTTVRADPAAAQANAAH